MKQKYFTRLLILSGCLIILGSGFWMAQKGFAQERQPQGTPLGNTFTYQGRLTDDNGRGVSGPCDLRFTLYESPTGNDMVGGDFTAIDVPLDNGYFTVELDFGEDVFTGDGRYLKIKVDCGEGSFTELSPRVQINPAPYSLYSVSTGALHGNPVSSSPPDSGDVLTWDGNSWLAMPPSSGSYARVLVVAKSGGDYTSIQSALDSISDAAYDKHYLVWVAPGRYDERVTMKDWVDIEGAGEWTTTIQYIGGNDLSQATVIGSSNAALRSLTVINMGGALYSVGMYNNNASPTIQDVTILAHNGSVTNLGMLNENSSHPTIMNLSLTASGGAGTYNWGIDTNNAYATLTNSEISVSGGDESIGLYNLYDSELYLTNTLVQVSSATNSYGIYNYESDVRLRGAQITVDTSTNHYGIYNDTDGGASTHFAFVDYSYINTPASGYIVRSDSTFITSFGASQLSNGAVDTGAGGMVRCYACYDENYQNGNGVSACP